MLSESALMVIKQVAASTTAPANTTTSAAVAQLGPHAGFERRRFAH